MRIMLSRKELAKMLATVRVEDVAREAGVSTKTIYRLRHQANSPSLDTAQSILRAIEKLSKKVETA